MSARSQNGDANRRGGDRRRSTGRRRTDALAAPWFEASWFDQRLQFMTRYVFLAVGFVYFNFVFEYSSPWLSLEQLNLFLAGYGGAVTGLFLHARRNPFSRGRIRIAMIIDILGVSMAVLNDPFVVPLSCLVYIVIVLGNGMRYGIRTFSEALLVTFLAAMGVLSLRYAQVVPNMSSGVLFLNLFGAMILVYAYILMTRIDVQRRKLVQSSRTDPLTGLLNRSALEEAARKLFERIKSGKSSAVVMFADLDKFKAVNDTFGHAEGDRVLAKVAAILRENVREGDIVARYGGDEFVVVLNDTNMVHAGAIAHRVQDALNQWAADSHLDVSMTVGLGETPRHGTDLNGLLTSVDRALYRCKSGDGGGGRVAFSE